MCGKRVGDLHALSMSAICIEFGKDDRMVRLQPKLGFVPKVHSTLFRVQVITLQVFAPQDSEPEVHWLCSVRALQVYLERTSHFRQAEQLFMFRWPYQRTASVKTVAVKLDCGSERVGICF